MRKATPKTAAPPSTDAVSPAVVPTPSTRLQPSKSKSDGPAAPGKPQGKKKATPSKPTPNDSFGAGEQGRK